MDDIAAQPARVLERVCSFLGVEYPAKRFARAVEPVHVGPPQALPPSVLEVLKGRLRPIYEGPRGALSRDRRALVRQILPTLTLGRGSVYCAASREPASRGSRNLA